jgi:WD40 repeat protein
MTRTLLLAALVVCTPAPAQEPPASTPDGFSLPPGAVRRFGNRQLRHPDGIINVAVSPDGKLLATASYGGVIVWDLKTLKAKRAFLPVPVGYASQTGRGGLAFLPDSKSFAVSVRPNEGGPFIGGSQVELAQVWNVETGKKRFSLSGQQDYLATCCLAADGKEIVVLGSHGQASAFRRFSTKDGKEQGSVDAPQMGSLPWVGQSGNVALVQSRDQDNGVVLDVATGKELFVPPEPSVQVAFSRDGKLLVWVGKNGVVHVHDLEAKKERFAFTHPEKDKPGPMVLSADNKTLYFTSSHGRLFRWDLANNKKGPDFGNRHNFWSLTGIALSPDESVLYSVSQDHLIKRWDTKTGKELPLPEGYTTHVSQVVAADGKHLILTDHEGQVDYWELATGKMVKQLQKSHLGGINDLAESADGKWLAGGRTSQDVRVFDLSSGKVVGNWPLGANGSDRWGDPVQRVAFAPDAKLMYGTSEQTGLTAWEVPGGKKVWNVPKVGPLLAVDPKGRWLAAGTSNFGNRQKRWHLLNAKTGEEIAQTVVEEAEVQIDGQLHRVEPFLADLAWLPDGSRLLSLHYGGTVRIWNPETRAEVGRLLLGRLGQLQGAMACSPDGRWLAVGWDRTVTVWELATRTKVLTLGEHDSGVQEVAFTRDGRGLVSNADLSPVLWDLCPKDLPKDGHWEALASEDGAKAYQGQWALIKDPATAVKLFSEQIKPAELGLDRAKFEKWVADLDSPQFRVREAAEKGLATASLKVPVGWLRKAAADAKSDESRARLGRILAEREKPSPQEWRLQRAVQVLELAGTPEANVLLKTWAVAEGSPLAEQATAAVGRLSKRP